MQAELITSIVVVVLAVVVLVFYVVRRSNPTRFRISATLARWFSISIEVDSQHRPDELPPRPEP